MSSSIFPPNETSGQFWDDLHRKHVRIGTPSGWPSRASR